MGTKIRYGVFETNSSSCHSMTLSTDTNVLMDTLPVKDGRFEYDCWYEDYCSNGLLEGVYDKLNYLVIYAHTCGGLETLQKVIAKQLGINQNDVVLTANMGECSIDHESVGNFSEVFESESLLRNVLFHPKATILCEYDG
jgi:hypothetical protein